MLKLQRPHLNKQQKNVRFCVDPPIVHLDHMFTANKMAINLAVDYKLKNQTNYT